MYSDRRITKRHDCSKTAFMPVDQDMDVPSAIKFQVCIVLIEKNCKKSSSPLPAYFRLGNGILLQPKAFSHHNGNLRGITDYPVCKGDPLRAEMVSIRVDPGILIKRYHFWMEQINATY